MTPARQNAIRKVRRKYPGLRPFRLVNSDDLGDTYAADYYRHPGYVIVEFIFESEANGAAVSHARRWGRDFEARYIVVAR